MKRKDMTSIGDMYGKMLNTFKHTHNLKEGKSNDNAFGPEPKLVGKGPHTDGYHKALNDEEDSDCCGHCHKDEDEETTNTSKRQKVIETLESKLKDPKYSEEQKKRIQRQLDLMTAEEAEEEIFLKENKKSITAMINSSMSKSVFDKLYSKVLKENFGQDDSDMDALGLDDATPDSEFDDEFGDEGEGDVGDEVSFTLSRDVAQQLVDVLQGVLGGDTEDDFDDMGEDDDLDFGDDTSDELDTEEDEYSFEEDEEEGTKTAPDKKKAFMGRDNKVSGPPKPKSGKAKADVTDDTNTSNSAPPIAALQGKNNQVPGSTLKKASDFFK